MADTRRIYVACLASYNNAVLHGTWIDVTGKLTEELQDEVNAMLASSPTPGAEEFAIHDYEGFGKISLNEYEPLATVVQLAELLDEHGEAFEVAYDYQSNLEDTVSMCTEAYCGCWRSVKEYVENYIEDTGMLKDVPDFAARYFDFDSYAHDLECGGDIIALEGREGVHIFNSTW